MTALKFLKMLVAVLAAMLAVVLVTAAVYELANAEEATPQPVLPSWLRLESGDLERCAAAPGGCTVWTDNDLLTIISITRSREREKCGKII